MDMSMSMPSTTAAATSVMSMTGTSAPAAATSAAMHRMGSMGPGGMTCKISMLWNWNTIGACFISSQWQITSAGMFAGSCIGVIFLVMSLEMLRRAVKEYDRFIIRRHRDAFSARREAHAEASTVTGENSKEPNSGSSPLSNLNSNECGGEAVAVPPFRPNVFQQSVRALLHMLQFAVAYFVMLLAMYYNGYFIICIFIGAYLGSFVCHWETFSDGAPLRTSAATEATVCCG